MFNCSVTEQVSIGVGSSLTILLISVLAVILLRWKGKLAIHIARYPPSLYQSWNNQWYTSPGKQPPALPEKSRSGVRMSVRYDGVFKGPKCSVGLDTDSETQSERGSVFYPRAFVPLESLPPADDVASHEETGFLEEILTTRYLQMADWSEV